MLFKIDENLPAELADILRNLGHDAATVYEELLEGNPDQIISMVCLQEGRAIVTLDMGFSDVRVYPPALFQGIIVLRLRSQDKPHIIATFQKAIPFLQTEPLIGKLWIVDETKVRIRD